MTRPCGLAIEAATDQLSLAARRGVRLEVLDLRPARDHTGMVYEHAKRLMEAVGADFDALDFIAFGCGPGSFTGVRIAAAAIQALAFSRSLPVCRVSSLAVLAAGAARALGPGLYGICQDARMEHAYLALYEAGPQLRPVLADTLVDPRELMMPGAEDFIALGDGWLAFPELLERHRARILSVQAHLLPSALDLLSIAEDDFRAGRTLAPHEALPEYLGQMPARIGAGSGSP